MLPIWKGQRIMDNCHAYEIKCSVGGNVHSLDSGYHVVKYNEETADGTLVESTYLIDGQHRASVIRDFYASSLCDDFYVTVTEKTVASEAEAIECFNKINNVKVQQWKSDPNLLINSYMSALEKAFNKPKSLLIHPGAAKRPYLSSDTLRAALHAQTGLIKGGDAVARFVTAACEYNTVCTTRLSIELLSSSTRNDKIKERSIKVNFALAYDPRLDWIRLILESMACGQP
jgi:hypothetical protein